MEDQQQQMQEMQEVQQQQMQQQQMQQQQMQQMQQQHEETGRRGGGPHGARVLELILEAAPADPRHWGVYLDCAAEAERLTRPFGKKAEFLAFLRQAGMRTCDSSSDLRRYSGGWREAFAAERVERRLALCTDVCLRLDPDSTAWTESVGALADCVLALPPRLSCLAHKFLDRNKSLSMRMVDVKHRSGDAAWLLRAYGAHDPWRFPIMERAVRAGDTGLSCALILDSATRHLHQTVSGEIFHRLDTERVVAAVVESGLQIRWSDVISNHRLREGERRADPDVRPLHESFYEMALSLRFSDALMYHSHDQVMNALESAVEMHGDGRVSGDDLDRFRDRLFSLASVGRRHSAYRYLLDESKRVLGKRFAHAVIPLAAGLAKRSRQRD